MKSKPKLLITEDDIESQKLLQLILRNDFEIDICDSEKSFQRFVDQKKYDAVLMDINLKGGNNGLAIIKELRKNAKFENLPVVGLSAHVFVSDRLKAREAGLNAYLTKPVSNSLLISTLKNLINHKS